MEISLARSLAVLPILTLGAHAQELTRLRCMLPETRAVAVEDGDLNGDGFADLFVVTPFGLHVWVNAGAGLFTERWSVASNDVEAAIHLIDRDADGDLDAIIRRGGENDFFENDGTGIFTLKPGVLPSGPKARAVDSGDFDGDGIVDVWLGGAKDDSILIQQGGAFLPGGTVAHTVASDNAGLVAVADIDGDGDLDAARAIVDQPISYSDLLIFEGQGDGTFVEVTATHAPGWVTDSRQLEWVDLDLDGDLDLCSSYSGVWTYRNNGGGKLRLWQQLENYWGGFGFDVGDVDQDGDTDLFLGRSLDHVLLINDGAGELGVLKVAPHASPASDAAMLDIDGDQDLDLVSVGDRSRIYFNAGTHGYVDTTWLGELDTYSEGGAAADFDGDGDLDLALQYPHGFPDGFTVGDSAGLYLNDGHGGFAEGPRLDLVGLPHMQAGDLDGDGREDLFAVGGHNQGIYVAANYASAFLNLGGLWIENTIPAPAPGVTASAVALADIDGDGDRDAYVACPEFTARTYLNDGVGGFLPSPAPLPLGTGQENELALVDVTGDGTLDLYIGGTGVNALHLGVGSGGFVVAPGSHLPGFQQVTLGIAAGDVDADGDIDLIDSNTTWSPTGSTQTRLLLNDGGGTFSDATHQVPVDDGPSHGDVVLHDMDDDGSLDILLSGERVQVYANDGSGTFLLAGGPESGSRVVGDLLLPGDFDGDGDVDCVAIGDGDTLLFHLGRQVTQRTLATLDEPLVLDVHGAPGEVFLLASGLKEAALDSAFGTMKMVPSSVLTTVGGVLDANGEAKVVLHVPGLSVLAGTEVMFQAGIGTRPELGNLERATVLDL